ncbi:MAG: hypothetical protein JKY49_04235 [Cohaesibacteraceae bacterium]|nr:hypothetical protein [Cohaesibacteraceae bacterium]MBL4876402.1 hypothetical protein [Cohaesibacteraceae bacterium]
MGKRSKAREQMRRELAAKGLETKWVQDPDKPDFEIKLISRIDQPTLKRMRSKGTLGDRHLVAAMLFEKLVLKSGMSDLSALPIENERVDTGGKGDSEYARLDAISELKLIHTKLGQRNYQILEFVVIEGQQLSELAYLVASRKELISGNFARASEFAGRMLALSLEDLHSQFVMRKSSL